MRLKALLNSPLPITNPHLLPGTGYSTEFIPGMFAGGPLGGGPPRCRDWMKINQMTFIKAITIVLTTKTS